MLDVLYLALSIDKEILETHFAGTFDIINKSSCSQLYSYRAVVYTQGFTYDKEIDNVEFVRDDTMYQKGYSISEIRDYFTDKALSRYSPEFVMHCDDDFKFQSVSSRSVYQDMIYMRSHPEVGLTCMHYHKDGPPMNFEYYYDFNPSRVATRSGILFRSDAFSTWGGEDKVRYFEEAVLATYIYHDGYKIKHSISNTIHKTKPTGLGLSLERKYGKSNIPQSGRKILHDQGLLTPSYSQDGSPRYDVPMKISESLQSSHEINLKFRLSKD